MDSFKIPFISDGGSSGGRVNLKDKITKWLSYGIPVIIALVCLFGIGSVVYYAIAGTRQADQIKTQEWIHDGVDHNEEHLHKIEIMLEELQSNLLVPDLDCPTDNMCQIGTSIGGYCAPTTLNKMDGTACSSACYDGTTQCSNGECKGLTQAMCKGECTNTTECPDFTWPSFWDGEKTCIDSSQFPLVDGFCNYRYSHVVLKFLYENSQQGVECSSATLELCKSAIPAAYRDCMVVDQLCGEGYSLLQPTNVTSIAYACRAHFACTSFSWGSLIMI